MGETAQFARRQSAVLLELENEGLERFELERLQPFLIDSILQRFARVGEVDEAVSEDHVLQIAHRAADQQTRARRKFLPSMTLPLCLVIELAAQRHS